VIRYTFFIFYELRQEPAVTFCFDAQIYHFIQMSTSQSHPWHLSNRSMSVNSQEMEGIFVLTLN
jgi:hypothetical protein